jgi:hypothetical protein
MSLTPLLFSVCSIIAISSKRVLVEHAIGGVKILRIVKDEIRIYK